MTKEQLQKIATQAKTADIDKYYPHLIKWMPVYGVDNPMREAAFIAQILHESGSFRYVRELASGQAYDTGKLAQRLGNTPAADGDGQKYKGRGLIQITGQTNYKQVGLHLGIDLIARPELLEQPEYAVRSALYFWQSRGLNMLATAGKFVEITRRINGGTNGLADRQRFYKRALEVLGV